MPKALTDAQRAQYARDGFLAPIRVAPQAEAVGWRALYDGLVARDGGKLSKLTNSRPHMVVTALDRMIRDARILDAVEDVIGGDILCWGSGFFAKKPGDGTFISWHQDATYWGLSSHDIVTAWVAFSPSTPESGCMRVVPGTHHAQVAHNDTADERNLLSRGQEIAVEVNEADAVDIVLQPGEMSLHHVLIVHGSNPNTGSDARIGYAIRYIPTHLRQLAPLRDSATLVRGTDRYGHFDLLPPPESDFSAEAVARHRAVTERHFQITYAGATQRPQVAASAM
jgi:ectoine hydroxylase-related dioxygenase (phytanoyl-CoA dioxygenase family)